MTGDQLRDWMARHHYTAIRLSAELGVAERTIFRWRTAGRVPAYLALALESLERRGGTEAGPEVERAFGGNALDLTERRRLAG